MSVWPLTGRVMNDKPLEQKQEHTAATSGWQSVPMKAENVDSKTDGATLGMRAQQCLLNHNLEEAVVWWRRAAMAGHTASCHALAKCLEAGHGVEKDVGEAIHWYIVAGKKGLVQSRSRVVALHDQAHYGQSEAEFQLRAEVIAVLDRLEVSDELLQAWRGTGKTKAVAKTTSDLVGGPAQTRLKVGQMRVGVRDSDLEPVARGQSLKGSVSDATNTVTPLPSVEEPMTGSQVAQHHLRALAVSVDSVPQSPSTRTSSHSVSGTPGPPSRIIAIPSPNGVRSRIPSSPAAVASAKSAMSPSMLSSFGSAASDSELLSSLKLGASASAAASGATMAKGNAHTPANPSPRTPAGLPTASQTQVLENVGSPQTDADVNDVDKTTGNGMNSDSELSRERQDGNLGGTTTTRCGDRDEGTNESAGQRKYSIMRKSLNVTAPTPQLLQIAIDKIRERVKAPASAALMGDAVEIVSIERKLVDPSVAGCACTVVLQTRVFRSADSIEALSGRLPRGRTQKSGKSNRQGGPSSRQGLTHARDQGHSDHHDQDDGASGGSLMSHITSSADCGTDPTARNPSGAPSFLGQGYLDSLSLTHKGQPSPSKPPRTPTTTTTAAFAASGTRAGGAQADSTPPHNHTSLGRRPSLEDDSALTTSQRSFYSFATGSTDYDGPSFGGTEDWTECNSVASPAFLTESNRTCTGTGTTDDGDDFNDFDTDRGSVASVESDSDVGGHGAGGSGPDNIKGVRVNRYPADTAGGTAGGETSESVLCDAAMRGDVTMVKALLARGMAPNAVSGLDEFSPLMCAAGNGHAAIATELIAHRADVDFIGSDGRTALICAASGGHVESVRVLLESGGNVNIQTQHPDCLSALHMAAAIDHHEIVKLLIRADADIQLVDGQGRSPVHLAQSDAVKSWIAPTRSLSNDSNVAAMASVGDAANTATALCNAAKNGDVDYVKRLLSHGAQPNSLGTEQGSTVTPLMCAAGNGHAAIATELIAHRADVDFIGSDGRTALICAASGGHVESVRVLVEHKSQVDFQTHDNGWSALHFATSINNKAVVRLLLEGGADVGIVDDYGHTAPSLASSKGHTGLHSIFENRTATSSNAAGYWDDPMARYGGRNQTRIDRTRMME